MKEKCSKCGKDTDTTRLFELDNKKICSECMYGDTEPVSIYPIGFVDNSQERSSSDFGIANESKISKIVLHESQKDFLYKLEDEESITVIYYLHKTRPVRSVFKRGLDGKEVGVFASRTPDRLSRLAIQDVKLIKIEDTTLFVEGLDAIDSSPVLDIKMCWSRSG